MLNIKLTQLEIFKKKRHLYIRDVRDVVVPEMLLYATRILVPHTRYCSSFIASSLNLCCKERDF